MQNFSEIWVILLDYKSAVSLHFSVWKMAASLRARENFGATAAWSTDDGDGLGAPMALVGLGRVIFHFLMGWVAWNSHSATFPHIFPSWSGQFWTHLWTQHRRRGSFFPFIHNTDTEDILSQWRTTSFQWVFSKTMCVTDISISLFKKFLESIGVVLCRWLSWRFYLSPVRPHTDVSLVCGHLRLNQTEQSWAYIWRLSVGVMDIREYF